MITICFLESLEKYVADIGHKTIIYRASNSNYQKAYQEVQRKFSSYIYKKQGIMPRLDFKPLTLSAIADSPHQYIIH